MLQSRDMPQWLADGNTKLKSDAKRVSKPVCPQGQRETGLGRAALGGNGGLVSGVSAAPGGLWQR